MPPRLRYPLLSVSTPVTRQANEDSPADEMQESLARLGDMDPHQGRPLAPVRKRLDAPLQLVPQCGVAALVRPLAKLGRDGMRDFDQPGRMQQLKVADRFAQTLRHCS